MKAKRRGRATQSRKGEKGAQAKNEHAEFVTKAAQREGVRTENKHVEFFSRKA